MKEGYKVIIIILISRVRAHTEQQIIQFSFEHEQDPVTTALSRKGRSGAYAPHPSATSLDSCVKWWWWWWG